MLNKRWWSSYIRICASPVAVLVRISLIYRHSMHLLAMFVLKQPSVALTVEILRVSKFEGKLCRFRQVKPRYWGVLPGAVPKGNQIFLRVGPAPSED